MVLILIITENAFVFSERFFFKITLHPLTISIVLKTISNKG